MITVRTCVGTYDGQGNSQLALRPVAVSRC